MLTYTEQKVESWQEIKSFGGEKNLYNGFKLPNVMPLLNNVLLKSQNRISQAIYV